MQCSACERHCGKSFPAAYDLNNLVKKLNNRNCQEPDKIDEKNPAQS